MSFWARVDQSLSFSYSYDAPACVVSPQDGFGCWYMILIRITTKSVKVTGSETGDKCRDSLVSQTCSSQTLSTTWFCFLPSKPTSPLLHFNGKKFPSISVHHKPPEHAQRVNEVNKLQLFRSVESSPSRAWGAKHKNISFAEHALNGFSHLHVTSCF